MTAQSSLSIIIGRVANPLLGGVKTALATRDRCAGDVAFANSASSGHCQAPLSRADLAWRPSSNRSPLRDFCLPSNLGNSFDAPEPTGFYTTDIRAHAEFSAHAESAA